VDDNCIYLRVIDTYGNLVLIQGKEELICDTIYFQSELSSRALLAEQAQSINMEKPGTLQLKKELEELDFMTVQVKANVIPQYAVINDCSTIKVTNNDTEQQLNGILTSPLSTKALLYGRMTMLNDNQHYVVDIISFEE